MWQNFLPGLLTKVYVKWIHITGLEEPQKLDECGKNNNFGDGGKCITVIYSTYLAVVKKNSKNYLISQLLNLCVYTAMTIHLSLQFKYMILHMFICVIFITQILFLLDYSDIFSDFEATDTSGMFLIIFLAGTQCSTDWKCRTELNNFWNFYMANFIYMMECTLQSIVKY